MVWDGSTPRALIGLRQTRPRARLRDGEEWVDALGPDSRSPCMICQRGLGIDLVDLLGTLYSPVPLSLLHCMDVCCVRCMHSSLNAATGIIAQLTIIPL